MKNFLALITSIFCVLFVISLIGCGTTSSYLDSSDNSSSTSVIEDSSSAEDSSDGDEQPGGEQPGGEQPGGDEPSVEPIEEYPLSAAYTAKEGESLTVCGTVVGFVGNSFYISDSNNGLYIYSSTALDVSVGDKLILKGTKKTFNGLVELEKVTIERTVESNVEIIPVELKKLEEVKNYRAMNVSFAALKVSGTLSKPKSGADYSVQVTDGKTTMTLFVSRYLSGAANKVYEAINNDYGFSVKNIAVSVYNSYQLAVTDMTTFGMPEGLTVSGIEPQEDTLTVGLGTAPEDIASLVVINLRYSNGYKEQLSPEEYKLSCENYTANVEDVYLFAVTYDKFTTEFLVEVVNKPPYQLLEYAGVPLDNAVAGYEYVLRGLPSVGNPKVLVIPVEIEGYKAPANMKERLEKAFFGSSEDTGWESLNSYYHKSSYGKLYIEGTVTDVYSTGKNVAYYNDLLKKSKDDDSLLAPDYEILQGALKHFDSQYDYSQYDYNNDGMIDGVYLIYTAPVDFEGDSELWWAYTYEYFTSDYEYYDDKEADFYMFMSYDFFSEKTASDKTLTINCETVIHETGHMLGLDDYYDYTENVGPEGGIGGGDMMDYNVGDHNAFSKLLLGWITPYVVYDSCVINLNSFGMSGDCVMICKDKVDPFSEYFIIDYYTSDGLNEIEAGCNGLFSVDGVRVYHVNATLKTNEEDIGGIWEIYANNNSDTTNRLISLVEADGKNDIGNNNYSSDTDLYSVGSTIGGLKWHDGTQAKFSIKVNKTVDGNGRKLVITMN